MFERVQCGQACQAAKDARASLTLTLPTTPVEPFDICETRRQVKFYARHIECFDRFTLLLLIQSFAVSTSGS